MADQRSRLGDQVPHDQLFAALSENSALGIWYVDLAGYTIFLNPAMSALLEVGSSEDLEGKTYHSFFSPDALELIEEENSKRLMGIASSYEVELLGRRGSRRIVVVSGIPVARARKGKIDAVLATVADVTAQRQAERERDRLFALSLDLLCLIGSEGVFRRINPAFTRVLGYRANEILSKSLTDFVHPDDVARARGELARLAKGVHVLNLDLRFRCKDGSYRWLSFTATAPSPGDTTAYAVARDVTAQKTAEAELSRSRHFIDAVAAAVPDCLYVYDLIDRRNLYANRQIQDLLGYTVDEFRALGDDSLAAVMHPEDMERWAADLGRYQSSAPGQVIEFEYRVRHRNGSIRWIRSRELVTSRDPDGRARQVTGIAVDITESRNALDSIRKSEERLRAAIESSLDCHYQLVSERDASGAIADFVFTELNERGAALVGKSRRDLLGKRLCEELPINREAGFFAKYVQVAESRQPLIETFPIDAPYVNATWLQHAVVPVGDGIAITTRDVSEAKTTETFLRAEKEKLEAVFDGLPVLLVMLDAAGRVIYGNRQWRGLVGGGDGAPRQAPIPVGELEAAIGQWHDFAVASADGRRVECSWLAVPLGAGDHVCIGIDLTERRQAEESRRVHDQLFRKMFEETPVGVALAEARGGRIVRVNSALCRMLGYGESDLCGLRASDVTHPEDFETERSLIEAVKRGELASYSLVKRYIARSGRIVWANATLSILLDAAGAPEFVLAIAQDITDRKVAEEERRRLDLQMAEAQRLESLGLLAGGIAHDFNNLLSGMMGAAGLAQMEAQSVGNPKMTEALDLIEDCAQRASELTRQMLAYSGRGRFQVERVNLSRLVTETASLIAASLPKKTEVTYRLEPSVPLVDGDPAQLRQVLVNLLVHASESLGGESGMVMVRTSAQHYTAEQLDGLPPPIPHDEGDYVCLEVSDTGAGLDAEGLARLFDPFASGRAGGRGLGLATVLGIVRSHEGFLKAASSAGNGTTIVAGFPVAGRSRSSAEAMPRARAQDDLSALKNPVLVVDDEDSVRQVVRAILVRAGAQVLEARNGLEAVNAVEAAGGRVSGVLLDMMMPVMGGDEAHGHLRARWPELPVLLMSGFTDHDVAALHAREHNTSFLQKPFRAAELTGAIRRLMIEGAPPPGG